MDTREFQRIKNIISEAELESAKSQGTKESIEKSWKEEYGFSTLEEAVEKKKELEEELELSNSRLDKLTAELENSQDWDKLEEELR